MSWQDDGWGPPLTRAGAAADLAEQLGCGADKAEQIVRQYIAETSERVGVSVANWTLDHADVDAMVASVNGASEPTPSATAVAVAEATTSVAAAQGRTGDTAHAGSPASSDEAYRFTCGRASNDEHVDVEAG